MAEDSNNGTMTSSASKKLSKEDVEKLGERLYTQSVELRKKNMALAESRVYHYTEGRKLNKEEAEESAARQATVEMELRAKRRAELERRVHKEEEARTMTQEEIDESIQRMYTDPIRIRKQNLEKLEQRHAPKATSGKRLTTDDMKALGDRLCKPKKTVYTDEEINKVYGF